MTAIDDLKPGAWIAVTKLAQPEPDDNGYGFGFFSPRRPVTYGGQPLEVLAISLPFVSVTDGKQVFAIDVRETQVQRLDKRYVRMMTREVASVCSESNTRRRPKRKRVKETLDPMRCPRCKCSRMVQRATAKPTGLEWELYCKQCGFAGELVAQ